MASEHWLRWHHGTVTDPKWRVIASRASSALSRNVTVCHVLSVWAAMLESASQGNPRGELDGWDDEDTGAALDIETEVVKAIREAMQGKTLDGDVLTAWKRRQVKVEDKKAADRKRAQRDREKALEEAVRNSDKGKSHGMSRDVTTEEEEEEEEEKKDQKKQGGSADAEPLDLPADPDAPADPVDPPAPVKADPIPYQAIIDLYNARMTSLAKVRLPTPARRTAIRRAWESLPIEHRKVGAFKAIFAECALDGFLNGSGPYGAEHENWRPDFDHLIKVKTITKVYEKAMARRERIRQEQNQAQTGAAA